MKITVAGVGYVGLSLSVLLAQHNHVTAVDVIQEKVDKLNSFGSPIQDEYIEKYFKEKVYTTVIPRNVRLAEAPSYGMPIVIYDPKSTGAEAYSEFADEFLRTEEE